MAYNAPITDFRFILYNVLGADRLHELEPYSEATPDLINAILEEGGRFMKEVMEPTNIPGDREGCQFNPEDASVTTPTGFRQAYKQFAEGGWTALDAPTEYGGQGLPHILKFIVDEMICATNLSLGMYPGLTHGAISALYEHGSEHLKNTYLKKLVSGEWTGTMCLLTEPQCGTDLGLIRSKAEPDANDSYRVSGTKIWITGVNTTSPTTSSIWCWPSSRTHQRAPRASRSSWSPSSSRRPVSATASSVAALSTRWASRAHQPA